MVQTGTNKGSKLLTAAFVIVLLAVVGGGTVFWTDREALVRHVKDADRLALPACWVLTLQGPPEAAHEPLCALLQHQDPALRAAACKALGATRSREFTPNLGARVTSDDDPQVRAAALEGLDTIADRSAIPYVRHAMADPEPSVMAAACGGVATFELVDLIPVMIGRLEDPDRGLRVAAKRALERFLAEGEQSHEFNRDGWTSWYGELQRRP